MSGSRFDKEDSNDQTNVKTSSNLFNSDDHLVAQKLHEAKKWPLGYQESNEPATCKPSIYLMNN